MKFSLIIPCYNEAASLNRLLERCQNLTKSNDNEVILVDNGSTDETPQILSLLLPKYPGCRTIRVEQNQGYGYGILMGLRAASGEILGWTHADLQTDPSDALRGIKLFEDHSSQNIFVKGKRFGRPLSDQLFTIGMSVFETVLLRKGFWDINAQPTMFRSQFFQAWSNSAPHDFSLDLFAYFMAKKMGLKVIRFPVKFSERLHGTSSWNINWGAKKKFISRTISFSLSLRKQFL
jgi:glycosyltransferase involved in cell wall biosynthesis